MPRALPSSHSQPRQGRGAAGLVMLLGVLWVLVPPPAMSGTADLVSPVAATRQGTEGSGLVFDFDIPSQPLADALRQYAALTREPTLFRSGLADGRPSATVRGRYSSETALSRMLDGTGLMAEKASPIPHAGFVLEEIAPTVPAPRASLGSLDGYPGEIQARVWQVLCADSLTAPGTYRLLLRFQVDAAGQIEQPRLLGSTGDTRRDAAVVAALLHVRAEGPPPPWLPQPVTMLIVPREAGDSAGPPCGGGGS